MCVCVCAGAKAPTSQVHFGQMGGPPKKETRIHTVLLKRTVFQFKNPHNPGTIGFTDLLMGVFFCNP